MPRRAPWRGQPDRVRNAGRSSLPAQKYFCPHFSDYPTSNGPDSATTEFMLRSRRSLLFSAFASSRFRVNQGLGSSPLLRAARLLDANRETHAKAERAQERWLTLKRRADLNVHPKLNRSFIFY